MSFSRAAFFAAKLASVVTAVVLTLAGPVVGSSMISADGATEEPVVTNPQNHGWIG